MDLRHAAPCPPSSLSLEAGIRPHGVTVGKTAFGVCVATSSDRLRREGLEAINGAHSKADKGKRAKRFRTRAGQSAHTLTHGVEQSGVGQWGGTRTRGRKVA